MRKFLNSLRASFRRQGELLLHARRMFAGEEITQFDSITIMALLILLTVAEKLLWSVQSRTPVTAMEVLQPVFLAVLLGWGGLSSLTYSVARWAKQVPDFMRILILIGAAGIPLAIGTLASVLITLACVIFGVTDNLSTWEWVHTVIGVIGLILGWPGYFSALAMQTGARIKRAIALLISLALVLILALGSVLPLLIR